MSVLAASAPGAVPFMYVHGGILVAGVLALVGVTTTTTLWWTIGISVAVVMALLVANSSTSRDGLLMPAWSSAPLRCCCSCCAPVMRGGPSR
jgi:hypothetical protein